MAKQEFPIIDDASLFVGTAWGYDTALRPGVVLVPLGAVDAPVPEIPEGKLARWVEGAWAFEDVPVLPGPEPLTLEQRRTSVWQQVKAERTRRVNGGAQAAGHWFHSDVDSRVQHMRLDTKASELLAAGGAAGDMLTVAGQPIYWKTLSNGLVPMTAGLAQSIVVAIEVLDALAFARAEALRAQVEASEDPEAIDITTGWPAVYEAGEGA